MVCTLRERGGAGAPKYHGIVSYVSKMGCKREEVYVAVKSHLLLYVGMEITP